VLDPGSCLAALSRKAASEEEVSFVLSNEEMYLIALEFKLCLRSTTRKSKAIRMMSTAREVRAEEKVNITYYYQLR